MTYAVRGLEPSQFDAFFTMDEEELARHRARRVVAEADSHYPCRLSLESARKGERLLLLHHVHHDVDTPYRAAFAIFVREGVAEAAEYIDRCPPVFAARPLAFRGFSGEGILVDARLGDGDDADATIVAMFCNPAISYIHAHNAAHGCFAARIDRHGDPRS